MVDVKNMVFDKNLIFEESGHVYRLNGLIVPSVTTIMRPLSEKVYGGVNKQSMMAAAERGTAVHNAIEIYNEYSVGDISDEYKGYLDAYIDWKSKNNVKVFRSEVKMYHKSDLYAGTADLLCEIDGKIFLVDYKTVSLIDERHEKMYGVQLEAYAQALKSHGLAVEGKCVLHIKKDGTWREYKYPARDLASLEMFRACWRIYNF